MSNYLQLKQNLIIIHTKYKDMYADEPFFLGKTVHKGI